MRVADRLRELMSSKRLDGRAGLIGGSFGIVAVATVMFVLAVPPVLSAPVGPNATGFFWESSSSPSGSVQGESSQGSDSANADAATVGGTPGGLSAIPSILGQASIPGFTAMQSQAAGDAAPAADAAPATSEPLAAQSSETGSNGSDYQPRVTSEDVSQWISQMQSSIINLRICLLNDLSYLGIDNGLDGDTGTYSSRLGTYASVANDAHQRLSEIAACYNATWPSASDYPEHANSLGRLRTALENLEGGARVIGSFVSTYQNAGADWSQAAADSVMGVIRPHLAHGSATGERLSLDYLESAWRAIRG